MIELSYIVFGIAAGFFSSILGLGGGLFIIPALVYIYGLTQHQAQGTSLAMMIPPITLLAAMRYYRSGNVKTSMALFLAIGFLFGGLLGANVAQGISDVYLKKIFGLVMLGVSIKLMLF